MTIASALQAMQGDVTSAEAQIVSAGGNLDAGTGTSHLRENISTIPAGGEIQDWCARFMNYDGTVVAEYSYNEVQALTELPALPSHPDVGTASGWTETLATIKSTPEDGKIMVGAEYDFDITYIHFKPQFIKTITLGFTTDVDAGVTIDWGDGNTSTSDVAGQQEMSHTYTDEKEVVIQLIPAEGCNVELGYTSGGKNMFGLTSSTSTYANFPMVTKMAVGRANLNREAMSWNRRIEDCVLSNNMSVLGDVFFSDNRALTSIVIPTSVTSLGSQFLDTNYALTSVVIPTSVTSIGDYFIQHNYALTSIILPTSVTSLEHYFFDDNHAFTSIVIPTSVTSIGYGFFRNNSALKSIVLPTSVTSIGNSFFSYNRALKSIVLPTSITYINGTLFYNNYNFTSIEFRDETSVMTIAWVSSSSNLSCLDFRAQTTVPTASSTNFFKDLPATTAIIVPDDLYEDFIVAENWSTVAGQIIKASDWEA